MSVHGLPAKWREIAKEQDKEAEAEGNTEAERDWHMARAQQAEECADELESALRQSGEAFGYVRRAAIEAMRSDDEVTGVMVHIDPPTDSAPVYLAPPATSGLVEAQPDTFFVISAPCWPGGIPLRSMDKALRFISEHGNEQTRLATWCHQYQRRDYTVEETKAMVAALAAHDAGGGK